MLINDSEIVQLVQIESSFFLNHQHYFISLFLMLAGTYIKFYGSKDMIYLGRTTQCFPNGPDLFPIVNGCIITSG